MPSREPFPQHPAIRVVEPDVEDDQQQIGPQLLNQVAQRDHAVRIRAIRIAVKRPRMVTAVDIPQGELMDVVAVGQGPEHAGDHPGVARRLVTRTHRQQTRT